jgi:hypothetical protein
MAAWFTAQDRAAFFFVLSKAEEIMRKIEKNYPAK